MPPSAGASRRFARSSRREAIVASAAILSETWLIITVRTGQRARPLGWRRFFGRRPKNSGGQQKVVICDKLQVAVYGGRGNCTRSSFDESCFSQTICENCPTGMSEECRVDATLRELVASWHRLTPDVRAAIMQLVRGRG